MFLHRAQRATPRSEALQRAAAAQKFHAVIKAKRLVKT